MKLRINFFPSTLYPFNIDVCFKHQNISCTLLKNFYMSWPICQKNPKKYLNFFPQLHFVQPCSENCFGGPWLAKSFNNISSSQADEMLFVYPKTKTCTRYKVLEICTNFPIQLGNLPRNSRTSLKVHQVNFHTKDTNKNHQKIRQAKYTQVTYNRNYFTKNLVNLSRHQQNQLNEFTLEYKNYRKISQMFLVKIKI